MKKNPISANHINNTLSFSKSFYKKACMVGSDEYKALRTAMGENPTYTLNILDNPNKNTYRELTFAKMREYIATQANAEENLRTLDRVIKIAEAKGAKYYDR